MIVSGHPAVNQWKQGRNLPQTWIKTGPLHLEILALWAFNLLVLVVNSFHTVLINYLFVWAVLGQQHQIGAPELHTRYATALTSC